MPPYVTDSVEQLSLSSRRFAPRSAGPRRDLAAGLAVVLLLAQLAFAQFTLALAICFLLISRLSRWRPHWLLLPAAAGLGWLLSAGPAHSLDGFLAAGRHLFWLLAERGTLPARLGRLRGAFTGWQHWLPSQLPVAVITGAVEAALLELPGRAGRSSRYRRGVLVLARCRYLTAVLRRGELATADGCCLGIIERTGARAELTWRDAEAGVLCLGQDAAAVSATGRDLVLAAVQHRKAVVVIDLTGGAGPGAQGDLRALGALGALGLADQIGPACAEVDAPLRRFSWSAGSFDPLAGASPAKAAALVLAMIDWTGAGQARRLLCASYLEAALKVIEVARQASRSTHPASTGGSAPLLDELISLLAPGALPARLAELQGRGRGPGGGQGRGPAQARAELAAKVAELAGQLGGDYSVLAPMAGQLAELARELAPKPAARNSSREPITITRALADREVLHFPLDRAVHGRAAEMVARLVVASLIDALAERGDLGIGCDGLVWIDGCDCVDPRQLAALISLGARTGTCVVLGTTIAGAAGALASDVNVIAVRGPAPAGLAGQLPVDRLPPAAGPADGPSGPSGAGRLSWRVSGPPERTVASCRVVR